MGMLKEFKEFALKGNIIDLAIAVIIGAAFGVITTLFAGWLPARKASKVDPVVIIRGK